MLQTSVEDPNVVVYGGVDAYRTANGQDFSASEHHFQATRPVRLVAVHLCAPAATIAVQRHVQKGVAHARLL